MTRPKPIDQFYLLSVNFKWQYISYILNSFGIYAIINKSRYTKLLSNQTSGIGFDSISTEMDSYEKSESGVYSCEKLSLV